MTIKQSILKEKLSETDFADIFYQSDLSFPINEVALSITDEHEFIVIGKDNTFKVISQVELASWVQINYVYMCENIKCWEMI